MKRKFVNCDSAELVYYVSGNEADILFGFGGAGCACSVEGLSETIEKLIEIREEMVSNATND